MEERRKTRKVARHCVKRRKKTLGDSESEGDSDDSRYESMWQAEQMRKRKAEREKRARLRLQEARSGFEVKREQRGQQEKTVEVICLSSDSGDEPAAVTRAATKTGVKAEDRAAENFSDRDLMEQLRASKAHEAARRRGKRHDREREREERQKKQSDRDPAIERNDNQEKAKDKEREREGQMKEKDGESGKATAESHSRPSTRKAIETETERQKKRGERDSAAGESIERKDKEEREIRSQRARDSGKEKVETRTTTSEPSRTQSTRKAIEKETERQKQSEKENASEKKRRFEKDQEEKERQEMAVNVFFCRQSHAFPVDSRSTVAALRPRIASQYNITRSFHVYSGGGDGFRVLADSAEWGDVSDSIIVDVLAAIDGTGWVEEEEEEEEMEIANEEEKEEAQNEQEQEEVEQEQENEEKKDGDIWLHQPVPRRRENSSHHSARLVNAAVGVKRAKEQSSGGKTPFEKQLTCAVCEVVFANARARHSYLHLARPILFGCERSGCAAFRTNSRDVAQRHASQCAGAIDDRRRRPEVAREMFRIRQRCFPLSGHVMPRMCAEEEEEEEEGD